MHLLDLIMYFVLLIILWRTLSLISDGDYTNEMGGLIGGFVVVIYTIVYIVLFALWPDWNWSDFDYSKIHLAFKW